jgi:hypothetical protein
VTPSSFKQLMSEESHTEHRRWLARNFINQNNVTFFATAIGLMWAVGTSIGFWF